MYTLQEALPEYLQAWGLLRSGELGNALKAFRAFSECTPSALSSSIDTSMHVRICQQRVASAVLQWFNSYPPPKTPVSPGQPAIFHVIRFYHSSPHVPPDVRSGAGMTTSSLRTPYWENDTTKSQNSGQFPSVPPPHQQGANHNPPKRGVSPRQNQGQGSPQKTPQTTPPETTVVLPFVS